MRQLKNTVLDIGTNYVKILQLGSNGKTAKYAVEKLPEGCVKGLYIEADDPLVRALRAAKAKSGAAGGSCVLTLSGKDMIIRHVNLPKLPEKQLHQNVFLEMGSYLPVDSEKYTMDYKIVEEFVQDGNPMYRIMVATVNKNIIERFSYALRKAGFALKFLDANENVQEKFLRSLPQNRLPEASRGGVCIIDMGADTTKVNVFKNGRFFVGYRLTRGGNNIRDVIAHQTSADIVTAENNKTKINYLEGNEAEPLVKAAVKNEVDSLIYEISKVADFYWSRTNEMLSCIILCGGASLMPGFENYFKSSITIPVYNIKDLMELQGAGKQIQPSDYAYLFNAYSAAFRED